MLGGDQLFDDSLEALAETSSREPTLAVHDAGLPSGETPWERGTRRGRLRPPAGEKDPNPSTMLAAPAITAFRAPSARSHAISIPRTVRQSGYLAEWLAARHPVRGVRLCGRWIDVGSPEDYDRARHEFGGEKPEPLP